MSTPIQTFLPKWHALFLGGFGEGLGDLIADEAVFYSPIVFAAQPGKDLV